MAAHYVKQSDETPERAAHRGPPIPHENEAVPCVPFVPWRCPSCRDDKPRTYGRRGRVCYHQCKCGTVYRSIEIDPETLRDLDIEALRGLI